MQPSFSTLALALAVSAMTLASNAQATAISGFTGLLAEANFTTTNTGNLNGTGAVAGTAAFTATSLTLTGGDTAEGFPALGCAGSTAGDFLSPCRIQTVVQSGGGNLSFDFSYFSNDVGGSAYDLFGVLIDGVLSLVIDPGGNWPDQSGSLTYTVNQSFGFFLSCTDCTGGNAITTVDNLVFNPAAAVPEPDSLALALGALGLLATSGGRRRNRRD